MIVTKTAYLYYITHEVFEIHHSIADRRFYFGYLPVVQNTP